MKTSYKAALEEEKKRTDKYIQIIYQLSEMIYKHVGDMTRLNPTLEQTNKINELREFCDSYIADEKYKSYLVERYINHSMYDNPITCCLTESNAATDMEYIKHPESLNDVEEMNIKLD